MRNRPARPTVSQEAGARVEAKLAVVVTEAAMEVVVNAPEEVAMAEPM